MFLSHLLYFLAIQIKFFIHFLLKVFQCWYDGIQGYNLFLGEKPESNQKTAETKQSSGGSVCVFYGGQDT